MAFNRSEPGALWLWDGRDGPSHGLLAPEHGAVFDRVTLEPDGRWLATLIRRGNQRSLQFWDRNRQKWKPAVDLGEVDASELLVDGLNQRVYLVVDKSRIQRLELNFADQIETIATFPGQIEAVTIRSDGRYLAATGIVGGQRELRVWRIGDPIEPFAHPVPLDEELTQIQWEPNSTIILGTNSKGGVRRWDVESGRESIPPAVDSARVAAWHAPTSRVVADDELGRIHVMSNGDVSISPIHENHGDFIGASYSPDGRHLLFLRSSGVQLIDAGTGLPVGPIRSIDAAQGVKFFPDSSGFVVWSGREVHVARLAVSESTSLEQWRSEWRDRWGTHAPSFGSASAVGLGTRRNRESNKMP
jgi:WD40 repeat protein